MPDTLIQNLEAGDTAYEDLMQAARYMRAHGWTRWLLCNRQGNVCALGAIRLSTTQGKNVTTTTEDIFREYLAKTQFIPSITGWNDGSVWAHNYTSEGFQREQAAEYVARHLEAAAKWWDAQQKTAEEKVACLTH